MSLCRTVAGEVVEETLEDTGRNSSGRNTGDQIKTGGHVRWDLETGGRDIIVVCCLIICRCCDCGQPDIPAAGSSNCANELASVEHSYAFVCFCLAFVQQ